MTATLLDGKAIAAQIKAQVAERVMALVDRGTQPGLAAVLVGDDEASRIYLGSKHKACAEVGVRYEQVDLPAFVTEGELLATIRRLNRDPEIHGIIVQLPVPRHISELAVQTTIDPRKDVDGLHPLNVGLMVRGEPAFPPATPYGIVELLLRAGAKVQAYDPEAMRVAKSIFGAKVQLVDKSYDALKGADALAVVTEWNEFREPDFARMRKLMRSPVVFDGRNIYSPEQMRAQGFTYFSIGR